MAAIMQRGFRDKLDNHFDTTRDISVEMTIDGGAVYDYCCFGVDANDKLTNEDYMVFYNQSRSPGSEIIMSPGGSGATFTVNLSRLPIDINKLVFTANIDGPGTMGDILSFLCTVNQGGRDALRLEVGGTAFSSEKAIVAIEIYRKDVWRISCTASGFFGGLPDLLDAFGGTQAATPPPKDDYRQPKRVELSKIELTKGQKVNLEKPRGGPLGEIVCNLNWTQKGKTGFLGKAKSVDLDLACLYELKNGAKGVIQALGNSFGSLTAPPYISLDADDRTGSSAEGEFLRINGAKISEIKRVLIFTFIYEGAANWREADAVVTVKTPNAPDIVVRLDEYGSSHPHCAIAMLENVNNETFSVEKLVQFYNGHKKVDAAYNWGMRWTAGRK